MLALNLKTKQGHSRMNKHTLLLTVLFLNLICTPVFAQNWQVATFGQSTDLNFSSLIDSAKIGRNNAWLAGNNNFLEAGKFYTLPTDFFIEALLISNLFVFLKAVGEKLLTPMTV